MKKLFCGVLSIIFGVQEIESMDDSTDCPIPTPKLQSLFTDYWNKEGEKYVQNKVGPLGTVKKISKVIIKPGSTAERVFEPVIKIETAANACEAIEQLQNIKNHATGADTVISDRTKLILSGTDFGDVADYLGNDTAIGKTIYTASVALGISTDPSKLYNVTAGLDALNLGDAAGQKDLSKLYVNDQENFSENLSNFLIYGPEDINGNDYVEPLITHLSDKHIVAAAVPAGPAYNAGDWRDSFKAELANAATYEDGCTVVCLSYLKSILRTTMSRQTVLHAVIYGVDPENAAADVDELIAALDTNENKQIVACDPYVVQKMIDGAKASVANPAVDCVANIVNINTDPAVTAAVGGGDLKQLIADGNQAVIDAILDIGHETLDDNGVKNAIGKLFVNDPDVLDAAEAVAAVMGTINVQDVVPTYAYTHLLKLLTDDYTSLAQYIIQNLIMQILYLDPVPEP